jgi:hypothetical protein
MKGFCLFVVVLAGLLLSGCAENFWKGSSADQSKEPVVACPTDANTILSCLAANQKLSRKEFKSEYKTVSAQAVNGTDADILRLICLSLHQHATYKQFKSGMETVASYIKEHPDAAATLQGIHMLMQRIDKEKIVKWAQSNKNLDEKEGLESENKELLERNEVLEKAAAQDQVRIKELQQQIEQLKNIENIIKNRER